MKAQYQLLILYALQGVIQTFFLMTLPLSLASRGYSMTNLGFFGLLSFGFTLKIIFAPIVDIYYVRKLGKRRTYIILTSLVIGILFLCLTIFAKSIPIIGFIGFFICLLNGIQDLALDGISVTLQDPAMMQNIGLNIGSTLNILFSVLDVNDQVFFAIMGVTMIIVSGLSYLGIKETKPKSQIQTNQIVDIGVKMILNKNLRQLILLTLFERLPLCLLDSVFQFKIVQAGVSKSVMAMINSAVFPFKLLSAYIYSRFPAEWKSYSFYPQVQYARLVENMIVALCLLSVQYELITSYLSYIVIYFTTVVWYFDYNVAYIIRGNFFSKVTTPGIEVLTLTLLSTSFQVGVKISKAMGMFISDYFNFNLLILLGLISHLLYIVLNESRYKRLANLGKSEWEIEIIKKNVSALGLDISPEVQDVISRIDRKIFDSEEIRQEYGTVLIDTSLHALSLELLKDHLKDANKCLDIGSGTGYMSLAMKLLANNETLIFGIDHIYELSRIAQDAIEAAGFNEVIEDYNILFITADGTNGLRRHKPLDCINVGIAFEQVPLHLLTQMRDNGRLVVPIGKYKQVLKVIDKIDDSHYSEKEYELEYLFPQIMTLREQCLDCAQRYESARQANANINIRDILYPKKIQEDL